MKSLNLGQIQSKLKKQEDEDILLQSTVKQIIIGLLGDDLFIKEVHIQRDVVTIITTNKPVANEIFLYQYKILEAIQNKLPQVKGIKVY